MPFVYSADNFKVSQFREELQANSQRHSTAGATLVNNPGFLQSIVPLLTKFKRSLKKKKDVNQYTEAGMDFEEFN